MPLKSKKSKSKRCTLRQKYKAIRKCKEHHKKIAKEAKKTGRSGGVAKRKKALLKDPGIPKQWPFKEQMVQEMQQKRLAILAEEQRRKEDRKAARVSARPVPQVPIGIWAPQTCQRRNATSGCSLRSHG